MRIRAVTAIFACSLLAGLTIGAADSAAFREWESFKHPTFEGGREEWLIGEEGKPAKLEGACGLAVSPADGSVYVSDYYHRGVGIFSAEGVRQGGISLAAGAPSPEVNTLNAVCGLALDSSGGLYANEFHQAVLRLPGEEVVDPGQATGVAVDGAGNVYVNDRTHVSVYSAPVVPGEAPLEEIGNGSLEDGYGLAVDFKSGTVYVADAADDTIKGYPPGVGAADPVVTIDHSFKSLVDASIAVDQTNDHVLVVDDLKQGFENPQAAVFEFDDSGGFLDRLAPRKVGEPGLDRAVRRGVDRGRSGQRRPLCHHRQQRGGQRGQVRPV